MASNNKYGILRQAEEKNSYPAEKQRKRRRWNLARLSAFCLLYKEKNKHILCGISVQAAADLLSSGRDISTPSSAVLVLYGSCSLLLLNKHSTASAGKPLCCLLSPLTRSGCLLPLVSSGQPPSF